MEDIVKSMRDELTSLKIEDGCQSLIIGSIILKDSLLYFPATEDKIKLQVLGDVKKDLEKIKIDSSKIIFQACKWELGKEKDTINSWNDERIEKAFKEFIYHRDRLNIFLKKKDFLNAMKEFDKCIDKVGPLPLHSHHVMISF